MPQRLSFIGLAALLTAALVAWTAWSDAGDPVSEAGAPPRQRAPARPRTTALAVNVDASGAGDDDRVAGQRPLDRDPVIGAAGDPFKVVSFLPPPPKPAAPPPPAPLAPRPAAPAFPYKYFGRMVGIDGKARTYLSRGEALVVVRERDVLDQMYRIDTIADTQIGVTYLPLDEKLTLATPSASH